jgi:ATP-binding cassette subfamily B protein
MSWILVLAVVVLLGIMGLLFLAVMPKFKVLQKLVDRLNLVARENISGVMVSRAYNNQDFEKSRFDTANRNLAKTNLFVTRAMVVMNPFLSFVMNGTMLLIIWFGAKQIEAATIQVGDMMAYMQYAMHVVMSFLIVGMIFVMLPRAAVSAGRIMEVLDSQNDIAEPIAPVSSAAHPNEKGVVRFEDVCFRYPGAEQDALSHISFEALPGETTAVIGATGSGKSTLAQLMLRFYDVTGGRVTVNGVDVRQLAQHDLRAQFGYVPQKSVLFTGSIAENLRFGATDASPDDLARAVEIAQASAFIDEKLEGYDTHIAQGGTNLSGGQRQRMSIARALAVKAPILVFDDSFSALDFKTDAALRRALKQQAADATLFIIAQRVGTIMHASRIIVLDEGAVVGIGTHRELLQTCPVYREIAESQLREEELA